MDQMGHQISSSAPTSNIKGVSHQRRIQKGNKERQRKSWNNLTEMHQSKEMYREVIKPS